ncbi:MAG TPA: hypothetical protein VMH05_20400 [Bryobacteraceae bacterium]|nr:hypothetical protein [Bryobacteraceae bacterium]
MNWYRDDAELDRQLRQEILAEPFDVSALEHRIRKAIAPRFPRRLLVAASAAFLLLLCVFASVGLRTWFTLQPSQVCSDAARDHLREIVRREPRRWIFETAGIDALGRQLGVSPAAHSRFVVPGYRLDRGKLCVLSGRLFLHLVYSNGTREFSLFLAHDSAPGGYFDADFSGQYTASVESNQTRAVIVTSESKAAARNLVRVAANAL